VSRKLKMHWVVILGEAKDLVRREFDYTGPFDLARAGSPAAVPTWFVVGSASEQNLPIPSKLSLSQIGKTLIGKTLQVGSALLE